MELEKKEAVIEQLRLACETRGEMIEELSLVCEARSKMAKELRLDCEARGKMIEELNEQLLQKEARIAALKKRAARPILEVCWGNISPRHPEVDAVYGHRIIIIDNEDSETGRWVLPPHDNELLRWVDYVPQETLFWRRELWEKVGGIDARATAKIHFRIAH